MKLKLTLIVILLLTSKIIYSQKGLIDSLEIIVTNKSIGDKDKIIPLIKLSAIYCSSTSDLAKAQAYIERATILSKKESDPKYGALSYAHLASF